MEDLLPRIEKVKQLSKREMEVLKALCKGQPVAEVAQLLVIEETTVHYHMGNIYKKLGIHDLPRGARRQELGIYCLALSAFQEQPTINIVESNELSEEQEASVQLAQVEPYADPLPSPLPSDKRSSLLHWRRWLTVPIVIPLLMVCVAISLWYLWSRPQCPVIAEYDQVIKLQPDSVIAYSNRGLAYFRQGYPNCAIVDFTKVFEYGPDGWTYYRRGLAYYQQRKYDSAITDFGGAIELMPGYGWAYFARGRAYADKGSCADAIANFEMVLKVPDNSGSREAAKRQLSLLESCR